METIRLLFVLVVTACVSMPTVVIAQEKRDTRAPGAAAAPANRSALAAARSRMTTSRHSEAQSAGYLALHLCTATFSSGLPEDLIKRTSGRGQGALENETIIDKEKKIVTVKYLDDMEPRIAAWRSGLGCTLLPIGAGMDMVQYLPRFPESLEIPNYDDKPWPMGDKDAMGKLSKKKKKAVEAVLDEAFKHQEGKYKGNTWGVVVVKDGKIVAERYEEGWNNHTSSRTHSMCKSLGATLVGIGIHKGLVDIHKKAPLKAWQRPGDPRGEITLNDLMHMASGLYTEGGRNPQQEIYASGAPVSEVSIPNIIDSKPGERFVYSGSDTIMAVRTLREALNDDKQWVSFPHRELLWKIGMTHTIMETDWTGDFNSSGQCWSTPRDFGRLGMLYLNEGVWNGERIFGEDWDDYVSALAPAQPASHARGGAGYGGQFWVYGGLEGLPDVAYSPGGALGQYAMIIPSAQLVVVRRGLDMGEGFEMAKFSSDILNALK